MKQADNQATVIATQTDSKQCQAGRGILYRQAEEYCRQAEEYCRQARQAEKYCRQAEEYCR